MPPLSPHFTVEELSASATARLHRLDNTPTGTALQNLRHLANDVLERIRSLVAKPVTVSSGYRSPEVNRLVRGEPNSQHVRGEAADINCPSIGPVALFNEVRRSDIVFDQIIEEFERWVHVSYNHGGPNRRQVLRARKVGRRTVYTPVSNNE